MKYTIKDRIREAIKRAGEDGMEMMQLSGLLGKPGKQLDMAINELKKAGEIFSPRRGLYVWKGEKT